MTWLAYLALGFYVYVINGVGPVLPGLQRDLGLDYTSTSLHGTVFAFGFVIVGLTGERAIRRLGRRGALWLGVAGAEGGAILLALAPSLSWSLPAMFAIGAVGGLVLVLTPAILADRHGPGRGVVLGEANAIASTAATIAPLLIGVGIALGGTWRLGLVIPSGVILAGIALAYSRVPVDTSSLRGDPAVEAVRIELPPAVSGRGLPRAYWERWLSLTLVVALEWCFVYWIAAFLEAAIGVDRAMAASSVTPFLAGMVLGRIVGARLTRRWRPEPFLLGSLALTAVGFTVFWTAVGVGPALAGLLVAGLGVAMLYPLALELALAAAPGATDLATTRAAVASGVAIGSGPFILGALADVVGLRAAYLIVPLLLVLAIVNVRRTRAVPIHPG